MKILRGQMASFRPRRFGLWYVPSLVGLSLIGKALKRYNQFALNTLEIIKYSCVEAKFSSNCTYFLCEHQKFCKIRIYKQLVSDRVLPRLNVLLFLFRLVNDHNGLLRPTSRRF